MPLSPIPEENENNSSRMPFQNGMKKTKNTNTYKYLQLHHPANRALASTLRPTAAAVVPSNATRKAARKAAKKQREANARSAKAAAANAAKKSAKKGAKKSAKKRTRKNRR